MGRLELPASCSQSKRATNCATPGYEVFQLWSNMGSAPVISLAEYAEALKTDKERGKSAKQEKPSIRAQLKAAKEQTTKKQARQKTQDLERS